MVDFAHILDKYDEKLFVNTIAIDVNILSPDIRILNFKSLSKSLISTKVGFSNNREIFDVTQAMRQN